MLRLLFRILGLLLLLAALVLLGRDLYLWSQSGRFAPVPLGQYWYDWSAGSLNLSQAVVQRYLWPPIWDGFLQPMLLGPAFLVAAALALLLLLATHRRRRRRWR